jgi:hypothetical protein
MNDDLLELVKRDIADNNLSEELGQFFIELTRRIVYKKWFKPLSYYGDRENYVIEQLCFRWKEFDPILFTNPYAFYTSIAEKALWTSIQNERQDRSEIKSHLGYSRIGLNNV